LAKRRAVSKKALAKSNTALKRAQDRATRNEAEIIRRQRALDAAETNLAGTNVVSTVDGTVTARNVNIGQMVGPEKEAPLFFIVPDRVLLRIDATVGKKDSGEIKLGDKASIAADAAPGRTLEGEVSQVHERDGERQLVIDVQASDLTLASGTKASVQIVVERRDDVLRVPNRALRYSPEKLATDDREPLGLPSQGLARLWILRNGQKTPVTVQLGLDDDVYTEIQDGELKPGDQLIVGERD